MLFKYLEAQIMDYFTSITPKTVLRQAKRVMRQINNATDGKLNTVDVIDQYNTSTIKLNANQSNSTFEDDDSGAVFSDASTGDKILLNGSDSNNGVFTVSAKDNDNKITVDESVTDETGTSGVTVVRMRIDSDYSLILNDTYDVLELHLPQTFNQLSPQGVIIGDDSWDEWSYDYVLRNTSENAYALEGRNVIVFGLSAWMSGVDTIIKGYFGLTIVTSSAVDTDIDIPEAWEECLIAGVLSHIAALTDYKDESIYNIQTQLYKESLSAIIRQEGNKYGTARESRNYNYANPSESS